MLISNLSAYNMVFASVESTTTSIKALKLNIIFPNLRHLNRLIDQNIIIIIKKNKSKSHMRPNLCQQVEMESMNGKKMFCGNGFICRFRCSTDITRLMRRQFCDVGRYLLRWMVGKVPFSFSINIWQENPSECWGKSQLCHNRLLQKLKWDLKVESYGKRDGRPGWGRSPL